MLREYELFTDITASIFFQSTRKHSTAHNLPNFTSRRFNYSRNRHESQRFLTAKEMLETATLGGAKALGLDHTIGSLEPGRQADIIAISLTQAAQQPINDIHTALVFSSNARDVLMTMVAGNVVYKLGT